jgi:Flp pilus assembly protein TadD
LDPETTPEEYRQRALLLADLGRYDEAAGEIAAGLTDAPADPGLLATLARIHLAAEQPAEALVAAQKAVAVAPGVLTGMVTQAMALTDSQRYAEAAQVAGDILRRWPGDAYAQRTGAALLSESRNGQEALNAAWNGVRVAPAEGEAHLVLAVVAARLRLFDLAQRAYSEALDLDPAIGDAQRDVGIVRFERRRWALALEGMADEASLSAPPQEDGPYPDPFPRPYQAPDRPLPDEPAGLSSASWAQDDRPKEKGKRSKRGRSEAGRPEVSRPKGPVLDPSDDTVDGVRQGVLGGTACTLVASVVTASMTMASVGISRMWAGLIGLLILGGITFWLNRRLTEPLGAGLARLRAGRRSLAAAAYLTFVAPVLMLVYALVGGLVPLLTGMVIAAAAEMIVLVTRP